MHTVWSQPHPPQLLLVQASASGEGSATRRLASRFAEAWRKSHRSAGWTERDVAEAPIPHVGAAYLANMLEPPRSESDGERHQSFRLTKTLQREVLSASHIVISTPMHIFSVPSSLKAWVDHIFHEGVVFEGGAEGVKGLLGGKRVLLITSRGGDYRPPSPLTDFDMLVPYFRSLFLFCGVDDFFSFDVHNASFDPIDHQAQLDALPRDIEAFARSWGATSASTGPATA
ncbi:MAG: NAD(P)H-dependent oxidoreductase [Myxococcota bacterium]